MKKQLILLSAATTAMLLASMNSFAELKTYAGVAGGFNRQMVHKSTTQTFNDNSTDAKSFKDKANNGVAELYAGIGDKINEFYVGGEANAGMQFGSKMKTSMKDHFGDTYSSWEQNPMTFGASAVGGVYALPSTLVYGKAGAVMGQFKGGSSEDAFNTGYTGSSKKWRPGMRLGAGVQYNFNDHIGTKLEYDYTKFKSYGLENQANASRAIGTNKLLSKYKPSNNQILLGVTYTF